MRAIFNTVKTKQTKRPVYLEIARNGGFRGWVVL